MFFVMLFCGIIIKRIKAKTKNKMNIGKLIFDELNLKKQARDLGVKVWQTPSFMMIIVGLMIVSTMIGVYYVSYVSRFYESPEILTVIEFSVASILLTVGSTIIRGVEAVARANKMKSEFVSIASHQLKTPIAEINWQLELLSSKFSSGFTQKQKEIVKGLSRSSAKMTRLAADLLDVAHIDQGKLVLAKEIVDLKDLIVEVIADQAAFAKNFNVKVKSSLPKRQMKILGDRKHIYIVLDNLLSNAIKYTDKKGSVEIVLEKEENSALVCVRDNGLGISRNEQSSIFQKFFRSNNEAKNKTDGTGLGLYISKNIIEQSGGKLWFESIEKVGSEFFFSLPLKGSKKKKK